MSKKLKAFDSEGEPLKGFKHLTNSTVTLDDVLDVGPQQNLDKMNE
jgi:hypothetical protein